MTQAVQSTELDLLGELEKLPTGSTIYLMALPTGLTLAPGQLLVQEVPESGAVVLRPSAPAKVPGLAGELTAVLDMLRTYGYDREFTAVHSPIEVKAPNGAVQIQRVVDDTVELRFVSPSKMEAGDLIHASQTLTPRSYQLAGIAGNEGARLGHGYSDTCHIHDDD